MLCVTFANRSRLATVDRRSFPVAASILWSSLPPVVLSLLLILDLLLPQTKYVYFVYINKLVNRSIIQRCLSKVLARKQMSLIQPPKQKELAIDVVRMATGLERARLVKLATLAQVLFVFVFC